jgi:concanavalin A-like lectin/glucanase superfamily protein
MMRKQACVLTFLVFVLSAALASVAAAADSGLVGWWKFDDGAGAVAQDSSGNGYDGTVYDAAWVDGNLGGALDFSGAEYVDVPPESWSTIETQATVCFWAYGDPDFQPQANFIFGAFSDPANNEARKMCAHVPWSDGTIYFDSGGTDVAGEYNRISQAGDAADYEGTWTHWTFLKNADTGDQQVYINGVLWNSGTGMTQPMSGVTKFTIGTKPSLAEGWYQGMIDDFRLYDRALDVSELPDIMLGKGPGLEMAGTPSPEPEAIDVPRDVVLGWTAGEFAVTHDVYLGTAFDDVNDASRANPMDVLLSQGQASMAYASPAVLEYGQTYYWRVDEVNAAPDNTIFKGELWSFTVEPLAYPVEGVVATSNGASEAGVGPDRMVDGSGLNENDEHSMAAGDMWLAVAGADPLQVQYEFPSVLKLHEMVVWNYNVQFELMLGFGLKDVTVEYSEDGENWAVLGDVQLAQGTATAGYAANSTVDFGGVAVKYVRLTVNSGYGMLGQFGLSEVRFLSIPVLAREPEPADGTMDVSVDAALAWRSGREAVSHEVYLGTDAEALALVDTVMTPGSTPDDLQLAATYYWQVTEVNEAASPSAWAGSVWSFTTEEFVVVDDFESYDDEDNVIYEAWIDGWFNETGSTVGYLSAPFAEQEMVHGGGQSMPLFYDNAGGVSETDLTLAGQDWTRAGITTLTLFFRGEADNTGGQLYVKINGVKVAHGGADALSKLLWQQWNIDLASVGTNLANVTSLTIGIEGSGAGKVYIDDIRLYLEAAAVATPTDPGSDGVLLQYTFDGDASDSSGNGYDGTLLGDARVQDGVLALDGIRDAVSVPRIGGADATFSAFTVSMWVHPMADLTTLEFSGGMNSDVWAAGAVHFKFHYGALNVGISGLDGGDLEGASMGVINAWNHIALTVSDTEIAIYLNGGLEDSAALDAPAEAILGDAALGAWNNADTLSREMTGEMDNVLIYDRALSAGEILFLSNQ